MASTIIIKHGTGSAVPTSLQQGELAINIDNGLFYFGSGSGEAVKTLDTFTNITASNNISASGNVLAENVFLPGAGKISFDNSQDGTDQYITGNDNNITIVGDQIIKLRADDHTEFTNVSANVTGVSINNITGHITASGNISSSGTIFGNEININGGIFTSASLAAAQASGDDLGNHTATQNLNLGNFDITSSKSIIGITGSFNQAVVTLKAGAQESPFIITIADSNGQDNKLEVTKDGILKFGALNTLPTAITGGLVYSSSAFYMGL